jgi:hypothetical protein
VSVWINELSFDRCVWSLYHLYAVALRIVLNFIHDVVNEEHSSSGSAKEIGGIARIWNLSNIEAFPFIFNRETSFVGRQLGSDS